MTLKTTFLSALCFVLCTMLALDGHAQISKSGRVQLNNISERVYLGPSMYEVPDAERALTSENIVVRHQNFQRGLPLESKVLNFGLRAEPRWLAISIKNNTESEEWFLDFGELLDGRFILLRELEIKNTTRNETYVSATTPDTLRQAFIGSALPIKITPGATEFITIYFKPDPILPASFTPSLVADPTFIAALPKQSFPHETLKLLLIGFAAFFFAAAYIRHRMIYAYLGGTFLLQAAVLFVCSSVFVNLPAIMGVLPFIFLAAALMLSLMTTKMFFILVPQDEVPGYGGLFFVSGIVLAGLIFMLLPLDNLMHIRHMSFFSCLIAGVSGMIIISFHQGQRGQHAGHFFALAWAPVLLGLIVSGLGYGPTLSDSAMSLNAYFYLLILHGVLMMLAAMQRMKMVDQMSSQEQQSKHRAVEKLAQIQANKDAADHARLLRVIERERELMSELREKEAQRTEEMRIAKEEADAANAAKSAFLAVVSHEIRTPMNGIMGILKLMQDTSPTDEQKDYLLTMQKTGDTMVALLNDILDFEKIETGQMELEKISFDLHNLAQGVVTLMAGYVGDKDVKLLTDIDESVPNYVVGDPTRLRQVILNLVSNAIKFTERGSVTIKLSAHALVDAPAGVKGDYEITFSVVDTGIGITQEAQEKLFEPFRQADSTIARKFGGTGLGLAISLRLVEIMGSAIRVESEPGEGSTFFFSLLMDEGLSDEEDERKSNPNILVGKAENPKHLLIVEDNEINCKVLQSLLEKDGHSVVLAQSAEEGLEKLPLEAFDAVFVDVMLPGMSGTEMAQVIRNSEQEKLRKIPLYAITGNVRPEDIEHIRASGINDVIGKPIDYEQIRSFLSSLDSPSAIAPLPDQQEKDLDSKPARIIDEQEFDDAITAATLSLEDDNISMNPDLDAKEHADLSQEDYIPVPPEDVTNASDTEAEQDASSNDSNADNTQTALSGSDYNLSILQSLLDTLGKDTLLDLVQSCFDKIDEIVEAVQADDKKDNVEFMHARMHELKGMCYNFGLKEIGDYCRDGENAAADGDIEPAKLAIEKLPALKDKAKAEIQGWLSAS